MNLQSTVSMGWYTQLNPLGKSIILALMKQGVSDLSSGECCICKKAITMDSCVSFFGLDGILEFKIPKCLNHPYVKYFVHRSCEEKLLKKFSNVLLLV